jgi:Protein of unknown function (DUF3105)
MRLRAFAWIFTVPTMALAVISACSHKISDHAPPAQSGGDAFALGDVDHFPGWDADAHPDATTEGGDSFAEGSADAESGSETSSGVDSDADPDADPDAGAESAADTAPSTDADAAGEVDAEDVAEVDDGGAVDTGPVVDECGPPFTTSTADAGSCTATIQSWADEGHDHYAPGTIIDYCTKPANSGPHYWFWAHYGTYDRPIPYGYLVHDLEHGAIDVYYKCTTGSCPTLAAELQAVIDARPVDPLCDPDAGVSRRVILSPDPTLPTLVAAAAWGWTYTADCVDATTTRWRSRIFAPTASSRPEAGSSVASFESARVRARPTTIACRTVCAAAQQNAWIFGVLNADA